MTLEKTHDDDNHRKRLERNLKDCRKTFGAIATGYRRYDAKVTVTLVVGALAKNEKEFAEVMEKWLLDLESGRYSLDFTENDFAAEQVGDFTDVKDGTDCSRDLSLKFALQTEYELEVGRSPYADKCETARFEEWKKDRVRSIPHEPDTSFGGQSSQQPPTSRRRWSDRFRGNGTAPDNGLPDFPPWKWDEDEDEQP